MSEHSVMALPPNADDLGANMAFAYALGDFAIRLPSIIAATTLMRESPSHAVLAFA
jgi:hypothetical protein